jgi:hypothetical protein
LLLVALGQFMRGAGGCPCTNVVHTFACRRGLLNSSSYMCLQRCGPASRTSAM